MPDKLTLASLSLIIILLVGSISKHILNQNRIFRNLSKVKKESVSYSELKESLYLYHGAMFNILAINNWILAFIAFGYYFFIIPKASDSFFYFQYIGLVSNYLGFFIFASIIFVFAIFAVFSAKMERLYSFYEIPRIMKIAMMFAWPFLMISIISSTYLATLTPWGLSPMYYKTTLELVSFSSLLISIALLITPFFSENIEAIRSRFFDQIWRGR